MATFAKRRLSGLGRYTDIQNRIHQLAMQRGSAEDLMMFAVALDNRSGEDIYIGLPGVELLALFPGFETIAREAIPEYLSTLYVDETGFAERFPDIAAKRNAASRGQRKR